MVVGSGSQESETSLLLRLLIWAGTLKNASHETHMTLFQKITKRTFDGIIAFLGIVFLWPLGLLIAFLIKISSPGPAVYSQKRIGQYGKQFTCYKYRTMVPGADRFGSVTTGIDKRITPVGKILRKYKLDELPQLWNVLIGKMSFVGPRPDVPGYADHLQGEDRIVLEMRPGVTGPASLCFRNEEELLSRVDDPVQYNDVEIWPAKVKINKNYYKSWSFWRDVGYIIVTILPVVDRVLKVVPVREKLLTKSLKGKV